MRKNALFLLLLVLALVTAGCETGGGEDTAEDPALDATEGAAVDVETEGTTTGTDSGAGVLADVESRGRLRCGVNEEVPGFGFTTAEGEFEGFDIDFCKVIAAGILGDATAVDYVPLSAEQRFTALQSGEVDVLSRNTTYTASRDGTEGVDFVTTTFFDGQGLLVPADGDIQSFDDLDGTAVCVLSGTTTQLNLDSLAAERGLDIEAVTYDDNDQMIQAFQSERCDAITSDTSQLAGIRSAWPEAAGGPESLTVIDEVISKEPLGPAVRQGDAAFRDAVNWSVIATLLAEEFEINSENVQQVIEETEDPDVLRFLGQPGADEEDASAIFDPGLGLDPEFAVNIVEQVGNYAEIFDRNVGPETALGLERGPNALYTEDGLHYPPPFR